MARPKKGNSFTEALRIEVTQAMEGQDKQKLRGLAEQLVKKGLSGDVQAIKEVADRLDGKPVQVNDNHNTHDISDPLKALLADIASNGKRIVDPG